MENGYFFFASSIVLTAGVFVGLLWLVAKRQIRKHQRDMEGLPDVPLGRPPVGADADQAFEGTELDDPRGARALEAMKARSVRPRTE